MISIDDYLIRKHVLDGTRFSFYSIGNLGHAEMAGQIVNLSYW